MLYLFFWLFSLYFFIFFKLYKQPCFPKKQVVFFKHVFFSFFIYFLSLIACDFAFEFSFPREGNLILLFEVFLSSLFSFFCLCGYCLTLNKNILKRIFFFDSYVLLKKIPIVFFQAICVLILFYPLLQLSTLVITLALKKILLIQNLIVEQALISHLKQLNINLTVEILFLFTVIFIVPCIEEFLFRGILQSFLREKLNNRISAILLSSFFFSLAHFSILQGLGNIVLLFNLFILSVCIGWFYERIQLLAAPIFLHMLFNAYNSYLILSK